MSDGFEASGSSGGPGAAPVGPDELAAFSAGLAVASVPAPALLRLSGPDRREALERVISQDVRHLPEGGGAVALLLTPRGHFRALMAVLAGRDELLLAAPAGHGDALAAGLDAYLRFSRSRPEPVAREPRAVLLAGPRWGEVAAACGVDPAGLQRGGWSRQGAGDAAVEWLGQTLLGIPGAVVLAASPRPLEDVVQRARAAGGVAVSGAAVELERIRVGFPAWGAELTEDVLPPETGIERVAISYSKGCYVGQETIARMRTYGHPNRRVVGVRSAEGAGTPALPVPLRLDGEESRRGALTSFVRHPAGVGVGLALVRREGAAPGARWFGGGQLFEVTTVF